jgi:hypothetical protein
MQSKNKFMEYFEATLENGILTVSDINKGKLQKNDILCFLGDFFDSRQSIDIYVLKSAVEIIETLSKIGRWKTYILFVCLYLREYYVA